MATPHATKEERQFFGMEAIIIGLILGGLLTYIGWDAYTNGHHLLHSAIESTLGTALYLTAVVAFCGFRLITLFPSYPRVATFAMSFFCGHASLFFDSFAVVLLLMTLSITPLINGQFDVFAFKVICAFNALTVGGAFFIGELWGLPYYITSGMDNPEAGLPLLAVMTPYCAFTSLVAAKYFPVTIEPVPFDYHQVKGTIKIVFFLVLIIMVHDPILSFGVLLLFATITGRISRLIRSTLHELSEGGFTAIALIIIALLVQHIDKAPEWFAEYLNGPAVMALSAICSPFAGAMLPSAENTHEFYVNLSWLMLGAPLFVTSSLVAVIVFRGHLEYEDLPTWLRWIPGAKDKGIAQEAVVYTLFVAPLTAGLAICLAIANQLNIFVSIYEMIS